MNPGSSTDKATFLGDQDVQDFVAWLAEISAQELAPADGATPIGLGCQVLCVDFNIKVSGFVPHGVHGRVYGIDQVFKRYVWVPGTNVLPAPPAGVVPHGWHHNALYLNALGAELRRAVSSGSARATYRACRRIVRWGGGMRSWKPGKGARGVLSSQWPTLPAYIANCGTSLSLAAADLQALCPPVAGMNSMLTKVHSLYATDGLPIYDSRVAGAIATLVEKWRQCTGRNGTPLPERLAFPSIDRERTVHHRFPQAANPGHLHRKLVGCSERWTNAKVRLGWILQAVLTRSPGLLQSAGPSLPERMRGFEAALFMMGYDTQQIR